MSLLTYLATLLSLVLSWAAPAREHHAGREIAQVVLPRQGRVFYSSAVALVMPGPLHGISLSDAQRKAIADDWDHRKATLLNLQHAAKVRGRIAEDERTAIRRFAEERNTAVRAILTAEQNAQLDSNLARMHEIRRQQAAARRGQR